MNKIMFLVAFGAMVFVGWLYLGEMNDVRSIKAAVTAAADNTAVALAQSPNPERNTDADADADGVFRKHIQIQTPSALEDVTVQQSVGAISAERLRQSVKVSARARTSLSEFFNMQGAEIEITATHDFDRKK